MSGSPWPHRAAESLANGQRLFLCFSACAGISDPERAVPALVEACRAEERATEHWGNCNDCGSDGSGYSCNVHANLRRDAEIKRRAALAAAGVSKPEPPAPNYRKCCAGAWEDLGHGSAKCADCGKPMVRA